MNYGSRGIFSEVCHNVITITTPSVNSINQLESSRMKPTTYRISNILNQHLATLPKWKDILLKNYKESKSADPLTRYIQS